MWGAAMQTFQNLPSEVCLVPRVSAKEYSVGTSCICRNSWEGSGTAVLAQGGVESVNG